MAIPRPVLVLCVSFALGGVLFGFILGRATAPVSTLPAISATGGSVGQNSNTASRNITAANQPSRTADDLAGSNSGFDSPARAGSADEISGTHGTKLAVADSAVGAVSGTNAGTSMDGSGSDKGSVEGASADGAPVIDFGATLQAAFGEKDRRKRNEEISALIRQLDPSQIPEALAYVQSLHLTGEDAGVMPMLIGRMAETNPAGALAFARSIPDQALAWRATSAALGTWARTSPTDALNWARMQPPSDMRTRLIGETVDRWGQYDPRSAWAYAMSNLSGLEQTRALTSVVGRLAPTDPATALQWANQIPDPTMRGQAFGSISQSWARQNPTAAYRWISGLAPGSDRDSAMASYASATGSTNPGNAIQLAETISNSSLRDRTLTQGYWQWVKADADAAKQWLSQTTALSDAAKQRLMQPRRK